MKNIIFFFSGTGNCLAVARTMAKKLGDTKVVSILALRENKVIPQHYEKIGFVYPTSYSHAPKIVMDSITGLQFQPDQKIFLIATAGGGCMYALSDVKKQLQPNTKNAVQEFFIPLPGNHIVGFSAYPKFLQNLLFKRAKKTIEKIVNQIQHDIPTKPRKTPPNPEAFLAMQARLNKRLMHVKDIFSTQSEYFTTDACDHCGICEKLCPVQNIKVTSDSVTFGDNCQQCMACIQWCPKRAIFHPNVDLKRKRYHHPDITLNDMLQAVKIPKDI